MARVTDLFLADAGSAPMRAVDRVEAIADRGLQGDRYFNGTGYYSPYDVCQVTFIAAGAIETAASEYGVDLSDGQHRRNVVVEGADLRTMLDHRFRVGDARLVGTRPRPPCAHVEDLADQEGVARALRDGRGGICADVVETGEIAVGDRVTDIEPLDRTDEIVERLRQERG